MNILSIALFVVYIGFCNNQNSDVWKRICYTVQNKKGSNVIFSLPAECPLPEEMALYLSTVSKSKKDHSVERIVEQQYQLEKIKEKCDKSFVLTGNNDDNLYKIYKFTLKMINSKLIFNEFAVEVDNPPKMFTQELKGMYGEIYMDIEYVASENNQNEQDSTFKFVGSYPSTIYLMKHCLLLQHEGLQMTLPLPEMDTVEARILYETTQIRFIYKVPKNDNFITKQIEYDLLAHPCSEKGSLKLSFVVDEKIDNSLLIIEFLNYKGKAYESIEYKYSTARNKLIRMEERALRIIIDLILLEEAIKSPSAKHIYLDEFETKTIQCEFQRKNIENKLMKQFGVDRYNYNLCSDLKHLKPGVVPYVPITRQEFMERCFEDDATCSVRK